VKRGMGVGRRGVRKWSRVNKMEVVQGGRFATLALEMDAPRDIFGMG